MHLNIIQAGVASVVLFLTPPQMVQSSNIIQYTQNDPLAEMEAKIEELEAVVAEYPDYVKAQDNLIIAVDLYNEAKEYNEFVLTEKSNTETETRAGIMSSFELNESLEERINALRDECVSISSEVDLFNGYYDVEDWRKEVVATASSLKGIISYEWDSKPVNPGWNEKWNTPGTGMDCSGFIKWVYWTATGTENNDLVSTYSIVETQSEISYEELLPGDLGTINDIGTYYTVIDSSIFYFYQDALNYATECGYEETDIVTHTNHVGIYAGKDENGNDIWIHCKGSPENTVVVGTYEKFSHYYKVINE